MPWYIIPAREVSKALKEGIHPTINPLTGLTDVSMFSTLKDALVLGAALPVERPAALLHVCGPASKSAMTRQSDPVFAAQLSLIALSLDHFAPQQAHFNMDQAEQPFTNLTDFVRTRTPMSAQAYDKMVGGSPFGDEHEANLLVYAANYYILETEPGVYTLPLEQMEYHGEGPECLANFERILFEWQLEEHAPELAASLSACAPDESGGETPEP